MRTRKATPPKRAENDASAGSVSISSPVHVFEPCFWTGELVDNFRLKDRAIFDGSMFNADPP